MSLFINNDRIGYQAAKLANELTEKVNNFEVIFDGSESGF